jgi:hypothetical protein
MRSLPRKLYRKAEWTRVFWFCVLYHKVQRANRLGHGWAVVWVTDMQPFATQAGFLRASRRAT